jgi:hypothetical protein
MDSLRAVYSILHEQDRQKLTLKLHFQQKWYVHMLIFEGDAYLRFTGIQVVRIEFFCLY